MTHFIFPLWKRLKITIRRSDRRALIPINVGFDEMDAAFFTDAYAHATDFSGTLLPGPVLDLQPIDLAEIGVACDKRGAGLECGGGNPKGGLQGRRFRDDQTRSHESNSWAWLQRT